MVQLAMPFAPVPVVMPSCPRARARVCLWVVEEAVWVVSGRKDRKRLVYD